MTGEEKRQWEIHIQELTEQLQCLRTVALKTGPVFCRAFCDDIITALEQWQRRMNMERP